MTISLGAVAAAGLLDGLNPCAFSVLLSFVAVILGTVAVTRATGRVWRIGGIYVLGMFVTYLLLGLGLIGVVAPLVRTHLAVRVIGMGVVVLGLWTLKDAVMPGWGPALAMPTVARGLVRSAMRWSGPGGVLAAGALVGMCEVPCSGAIYIGVLALIAAMPWTSRLGYLLLYNVMFVAPLLVLLAMVGNRTSLNRITHWTIHQRTVSRLALGSVTVLLGFAILFTA